MKKIVVVFLAAAIGGTLFVLNVPSRAEAQIAFPTKPHFAYPGWEYKVVRLSESKQVPRELWLPDELTAMGREGWELIQMPPASDHGLLLVFKRPVHQ